MQYANPFMELTRSGSRVRRSELAEKTEKLNIPRRRSPIGHPPNGPATTGNPCTPYRFPRRTAPPRRESGSRSEIRRPARIVYPHLRAGCSTSLRGGNSAIRGSPRCWHCLLHSGCRHLKAGFIGRFSVGRPSGKRSRTQNQFQQQMPASTV